MSERDGFPAAVPCWVDTMGPDPERLMDFYGAVLGWEFAGPGEMPGEPPGRYYVARLRDRDVAGVASLPAGAPSVAGWNTYVRVESADDAAEAVANAGGTVTAAPFDAPPAGRAAVVADPQGASFCLWEPADRQGAELVNEPGAWSMSALNTADTDSAAAFYGEVFGWETEAFDFGDAKMELFRLPGFVGGEPRQPVPRDVVAVMMTADSGVEPHWSVDFWVADADAAAAAASEHGGTVIAPPQDSPGFRSTVVADPNGAVLSASQLLA